MKKRLWLAAILLLGILLLACACDRGSTHAHTHVYNIEKIDDAYLKTPASENASAIYYYSCSCGEKGEDTFTLPNDGQNNDTEDGNTEDNKDTEDNNNTEAPSHVYETGWTSDEENHWHACTDASCLSVSDKACHAFGEWLIAQAPTCTSTGIRHRDCTVCGKRVSESFTDPTAHSYASDWTGDGDDHWHNCQNSGCTAVSDKASHTFGAWVVDQAPTCTSTGIRHRDCTVCGKRVSESFTDPAAHSYASDWTGDGDDHWHNCQNSGCTAVSDKTSHTFGAWVVDQAPTCSATGVRHRDCTVCGKSVTESLPIDPTAHAYSSTYSANATHIYKVCTENGCTATTSETPHSMTFRVSDGKATLIDHIGTAVSVIIPSSYNGSPVTDIGAYAFWGQGRLTSITLPFVGSAKDDTYSSHFGYIFGSSSYVPSALKTVVITGGTTIDSFSFEDCSGLTSITIPNSVTSIGDYAFESCRNLTSVTISDSVTSIGSYAFAYCDSLTSITIPSSVTSIDSYAFTYCRNLTSIKIESGVTEVGGGAFSYCDSLTSISLPDSVTSIGSYAFAYCDDLVSIAIGEDVTSIGTYAFAWCDSLKSISFGGSTAQWKWISKGKDWNFLTGPYKIYCTDDTLSK